MKRRQFLVVACGATAFANACKKDEPGPPTTVQGYITDSQGKPVIGIEVEYFGSGGGGNPSQVGGFGSPSPSPYVSFSEKSWTDDKGFFKIIKTMPGGIDSNDTYIFLSATVAQKYTKLESKKNGVIISNQYIGVILVASGSAITLGAVNEYLVTLK